MYRPLPQDVEVANVIRVFRNLAAEKGCFHKSSKIKPQAYSNRVTHYKIPELRIKKRESQGLPPLPKGNPEKVRKALKGVKFIEASKNPQEKNQVGNKYLIFLGCAIPYRVSAYEISARKVLGKLGVELVEMPEFNCCGLPLDPVSHETMLILAAKNLGVGRAAGTQHSYSLSRMCWNPKES
jgi:Fe-S oxidoreductase